MDLLKVNQATPFLPQEQFKMFVIIENTVCRRDRQHVGCSRALYIANNSSILYNRPVSLHGGHGEKVITGVCGTSITGSIPVDRPTKKLSVFPRVFLFL
jgi:hypothetical protein